jgi:hypothetical protein
MKTEQLYKLTTSVRDRRDAAAPRVPEAGASDSIDFGRALDAGLPGSDFDGVSDLKWLPDEDLEEEIERANVLASRLPNRSMSFELSHDAEQPAVRILDRETQQVVREMSTTDFLNFMAAVQQTVGLFFDRLA